MSAKQALDQKKKSEKIRAKVILIVEDDPLLANLYSQKFMFEGFNVLVSHDGETGMQLATEKNPDFILLDIMLPNQSGFDVLENLKSHPRGKHIPVIALTNLTKKDDADKALKLGAKEYLAKAMQTPEDIVDKVKQYIA